MNNDYTLTKQYSSSGHKLLRHLDVLYNIQRFGIFNPITVQFAPTEACDMNCSYCSIAMNKKGKIDFNTIVKGLKDFKFLGAKSLEITGGGNPLLYRDGKYTIKDIISLAHDLNYKIGIITNSTSPIQYIGDLSRHINWIRVSLSGLDQGFTDESYDLSGFDGKVGLSYVVHDATTNVTIEKIIKILDKYKNIKFVRIVPDCLQKDFSEVQAWWEKNFVPKYDKIFFKDMGVDKPYPGNCYVGLIRPYWTFSGVYICTCHVLVHQRYDDDWKLCDIENVIEYWNHMTNRFQSGVVPYDIDIQKCYHCYYYNNNEILNNIVNKLPDEEFS